MDEINDFFDFSKSFQKKIVRDERVSAPKVEKTYKSEEAAAKAIKLQQRADYVSDLLEQERIRLDNMDVNVVVRRGRVSGGSSTAGGSSCMDDVDGLSSNDSDYDNNDGPTTKRPHDDIYDRFPFDMQRDESLPIFENRDEIISMIEKYPVVVLQGDTGCGKTTQVPQYILDDACRRREYCKIVCTQPRRIAAISLAKRVCHERKWLEGTVVGYQVGLYTNVSEDTRLVYCTNGVLLQKLIRDKNLSHYTHIILDEVHERGQDMDFLLLVIRRLLTLTAKRPKIILMSATIDTLEFSNYFKIRSTPAPVLKVSNKRVFKVKEYYLSDLLSIITANLEIDHSTPGISNEVFLLALKLFVVFDKIDKKEAELNLNISDGTPIKNSVLVFLPGIHEIDRMWKSLEQFNTSDENSLRLSPMRLHSLISPDEQINVFKPPPPGFRKVILATNIAESSITVPDVKYVIDFCLNKTLVTDTASTFSYLQLQWASKANCKQRAGRAGRVMNGRVYRLVPRQFYEEYFEEFSTPEILRCPLEDLVLRAKILDMGPPPDILSLAMNPPNLSDIHNTILTLKELGALHITVNGNYSVQDGDISFIGRVMAALPVDIRLSRLIVLGHMFSVLEDAIIIAAGLSVRSIFKINCGSPLADYKAYLQKLVWADGSGSDLFAILKAYRLWCSMREQNNLSKHESEQRWANRFYINLRSIKEMHVLIQDIKNRLVEFNITENQRCYQRVHWMDREKTIVLKIIFAGAFYPNYFIRSGLTDMDHERSVYRVLCGNDPCSTVYFKNFNAKLIGQLYASHIKEIFRDASILPKDIDVRFQPGSEKVFVTFNSEETYDESGNCLMVPGKVKTQIYKAVRMRMAKMKTDINVMDIPSSIRYAEQHGYGKMVNGVWQPLKQTIKYPDLIVLPSMFEKKLSGHITHIEHCSKFYFLPVGEKGSFDEINEAINDPAEIRAGKFDNADQITRDMILLAPLNNTYRRAKVIKILEGQVYSQFEIYFIDIGSTLFVAFDQLRALSPKLSKVADIPPRIFECRLAMIQPSTALSPDGKWLDVTKDLFQKHADSGEVEIEVFSVVESVANVFLNLGRNKTFNEQLVEKQYARKTDENYMSKTDHDLRQRNESFARQNSEEDCRRRNTEYIKTVQPDFDLNVEPPPRERCNKIIRLRGPFSPLETRIYSVLRVGARKCVQVEKESVNSVLIDTDPQDVHERLIVAAGITETQSGETIVARSTTLMPNIHGFGALMTMLFCPTMQIKRNKNCTKFAAILAGLGYDPRTYKPLYAEHDFLLNLDVEIKTEDIEMINHLRYCMSCMLFTDYGDDRPTVMQKQIGDMQATIKETIIKLLSKNRKYIEINTDGYNDVWEYYEPWDVLETKNVLGERASFPFLTSLCLFDEGHDQIQALKLHCQELHTLGDFDATVRPVTCRLCNQHLENIVQIRIHLLSQLHRDREQQICYKPIKK